MKINQGRLFATCFLIAGAYAQMSEGPQPAVVDPGGPGKPPSDAIVLFNGRDNVRAADPMLQIDVVPGWKEKSAAS